jgi:hypothetical protein
MITLNVTKYYKYLLTKLTKKTEVREMVVKYIGVVTYVNFG